MRYFPFCPAAIIRTLIFIGCVPALLLADNITGSVHDSSGAVIRGATVEISGPNLLKPLQLKTDPLGNFTSLEMLPGTYTIRILQEGFEPLVRTVELHGNAQLQLSLAIARKEVTVSVSGKVSALANSDPVYRQLRDLGVGETYRIDNLSFVNDVGAFRLANGTLTLLAPVNGITTGAVFLGDGHFSLRPVLGIDARDLQRRSGNEVLEEDFTAAVFRFSANEVGLFSSGLTTRAETPIDAASLLNHWRDHVRDRHEIPETFAQALLEGETMDNVDADLLGAIYNPKHPPFFNAYIHGKKHKDLRFFVRQRVGAIPQIDSPEEVALINFDPLSLEDGIWYLSHLKSEFQGRTANSAEERRLFATHAYKIETVIGKNHHLFSTAQISFASLVPGERVMKFGLLPNLRVAQVTDGSGQELYFIQESRKQDGSFYVILPQALPVGQEQKIHIEYSGDKVLETAGEGSFYVRARTAWYPNLNGFGEKALFDLTFKVPRKYKVISVGALQGESVEQDLAVTHWVTPVPVAVAGFNYGDYKRLELADEKTGYTIFGYYLEQLPDNLRGYDALRSLAPHAMTEYAVSQTRTQLQICTYYFGKSPYDTIAVTEQPNFNFGQSWPNLVYLPISAYTDSTQRWLLFGRISDKFTGFVQEVTPHEVAHQWWGHAVGWASYHDQWLSEGFAEFSAGLYLREGVGPDWRKDYLEFWERQRKRILDKNNFGTAPTEAGPLWLGLRLISPKTPEAYQNVTYPKGAYVLEMLRSIMFSSQDGDKAFIDMMHDFVESHRHQPASTESFKAIAEKHITKTMDLTHNGRLDWFFGEWVYGTQVPRYKFDYQTAAADQGKVKLHMTITQSEVDENFGMLVPVYVDMGKGLTRLGQFRVVGNSSSSVDVLLPSQPKKVVFNAYKEILER